MTVSDPTTAGGVLAGHWSGRMGLLLSRTPQGARGRAGFLGWALLLATLGCGDRPSGPGGDGAVEIRTTTTGDVPDPDGYQVTVDDGQPTNVPATGTVALTSLPAGSRNIRLTGVANHCVLGGDNPKVVTVVAGETVTVNFDIVCGPAIGSVELRLVTTGNDIDPDGYLVRTMDPAPRVASNGSIVIPGLPAGEVQILIDDIAPNCAFVEGPKSVIVPPDGRAQVQYTLACLGRLPNDLAFAGATSGDEPADIYRMNANGSDLQKLTASPEREFIPSWSPDGSRIAFVRLGVGQAHLFMMNADGGNIVDLNFSVNPGGLAWSPDGAKLAVTSARDIFVVNSDGTGASNLTNRVCLPTTECGGSGEPTWSPDGTRIAFSQSFGILGPPQSCFTMNSDGTASTLVKESCTTPTWSPDGSRIAFAGIGFRPDNLAGHVLAMNPDGSETVDLSLVSGSNGVDQLPSWSPDGGMLAFVSDRNIPEDADRPGPKIFVMNPDGTGVRHVTLQSGVALVGRPTWSPALR